MPANPDESIRFENKRKVTFHRLCTALILIAALWLASIPIGRVFCRIAINQIAEFTHTKIETKSVRFKPNGVVLIKELVIRPLPAGDNGRPKEGFKYDNAILKAKTVYARFGIGSLLLLKPRLKKISVKDFVFNAQYDYDSDKWNLSAFKVGFPKGGSGKMPRIRLKRGTVQYSTVSNGKVKVAAAVPIDAKFGSARKTKNGYSFDITTAERAGFAKSVLSGLWKPGNITVTGGISSADIPEFDRVVAINALSAKLNYDQDKTYSMSLHIKDLLFAHSAKKQTSMSYGALPENPALISPTKGIFNKYDPEGQIDIDIKARGNLERLQESKVVGKIHLKDFGICYSKFPYSIDHIAGQIDFTEKNISLNNLRGRHGDVKVAINGWFNNLGPSLQSEIQITSDNMVLDNDLYKALNKNHKNLWLAFFPSGLVAIDYRITKQPGTRTRHTLDVNIIDVEAVYTNFPYPLKNLTGKLFFDLDSIDISNIVSQFDGRKITINGKVTDTNTHLPKYDVLIKVNNIPLDSTLEAALPKKQGNLYRQFNLSGRGDGQIKVTTQEQGPGSATFVADLSFNKTSLKAKKFPLTISDITAKAIFRPDLIHFKSFTGRYGGDLISMTGRIWPGQEADQLGYSVLLSAEQVDLNDDLFSILPKPLKKIVPKLQPRGKINYTADLNKDFDENYSDYKIDVECLGNTANFKLFPYPLKDIRGKLTITKNSIKLYDVVATAADNIQIASNTSSIKVNGQMNLTDDAFSGCSLELYAKDIFFDERLGIALPEEIQEAYFRLSPTGRFDLELEHIKIPSTNDGEKYIDFAGTARFKDCNFKTPFAITKLDAVLEAKCLYKIGEQLRNGQVVLTADNITIKDKTLTNLKTEIYYDEQRQSWLTKKLAADCYEGKLTGKFELKQPRIAPAKYLLQVGFDNIDLEQFLSNEESSYNGLSSGKMNGSLSIAAQIGNSHSRIGRCRLQISDMQAGKLSPIGKLLGVLKLTEPKDFAFEKMLVDSYIKHTSLFFRKIDLSGEAVAFNGSGWMNLQEQNVDLILTARGRRVATSEPSLLQSLAEGLGYGVVRMEVTGNIYDPQVKTKTLPVIRDAIEILGIKPKPSVSK